MDALIRHAEPGDYEAYARLFAELETGDRIAEPERFERDIMPTTRIVELGGSIVGYAYFERYGEAGYIRNVAVSPEQRRRGFGRRLMAAIRDELRAAGAQRWHLNVKSENVAAIRLYEGFGLATQHRMGAFRTDWTIRAALPSAKGIVVSPITRDDASRIEQAFELIGGQLADKVDKPGIHLLQARPGDDEESFVGLASFSPAFPGAYPFNARSTQAARALLDAMYELREPNKEEINLVVEKQPALWDALLAAGAELRLDLVHMEGEI